jgi:hypothetical protein
VTSLSGFAYAQARLQSRYGERADEHVWLRLHNIADLGSYLQVAQQTPLRPWVLGIGPGHDSHEMELALRQKFRHHVDEVAGWLPANWQSALQWVKRLPDLPVLQYLLSSGAPADWMKLDPEISQFSAVDATMRLPAMSAAGCDSLVNAWLRGESMLDGWLLQWNELTPRSAVFNEGLQRLEHTLLQQLHIQTGRSSDEGEEYVALAVDYEQITDSLRRCFRQYAFQPAAACAYLAIIAVDMHHIRSDLMRRLFFQESDELAAGMQ